MTDFLTPTPIIKEGWRDADAATRATWRTKLFIGHPQVMTIHRHIINRLEHLDSNLLPVAMAVIGGTGAGKTTLVKQLINTVSARYVNHSDDRTLKPCVQLSIPDNCNPYELSVALLEELGEHQPRARRDKSATVKASAKFLKTCEVRVVIVDNLQDVPERRGKRGIEKIAAHLRNLIDASNALWIFLGTDAAIDVLHSNDQFLRRVAHRSHLDYFRMDTPLSTKTFNFLLRQLDRWLPLAEPSCLCEQRYAAAVFFATEGIFDRIVQLLDRAWQEAVNDGTEKMSMQHLASAYIYVNGNLADSANPFASDFVVRLLDKPGEPFEVLHGGGKRARRKS